MATRVPRLFCQARTLLAAPRLAAFALVAMLLGGLPPARAEEAAAVSERAVKTAFLYKFLGYVEWPPGAFPQPDSPLVVAFIGADEVAGEFAQLSAGRTVESRPIVVRRVHDPEALAGVHALFIGRSESARLGALVKAAQQRSILTVTEVPGALDLGSVINFLLLGGRVRFEIAMDVAEKSGLKLSSRLLAVAQSVRTGG
jgi:hypothetical protein